MTATTATVATSQATASRRQYFVRYTFIIKGYDVGYLDVFIDLEESPTQQVASRIIDRALYVANWVQLNFEATFPTEKSALYREGEAELWDWKAGLQDPVIPGPVGKALVRWYRIRDASSKYPYVSPSRASEKWVDRARLV